MWKDGTSSQSKRRWKRFLTLSSTPGGGGLEDEQAAQRLKDALNGARLSTKSI